MEVSSHALDQFRVDGTAFAAVCFTNLSQDHLDFHHTMDEYFEAKARLFDGGFSRRVAVSIDDPYGTCARATARVANGLDVWTLRPRRLGGRPPRRSSVECTAECTRFDARLRCDDATRRSSRRPCSAISTSRTLLAAAATARAGGLPFDAVVAGLAVTDPCARPVRAGRRRRRLRRHRRLRAHARRARARVVGCTRADPVRRQGRGRLRLRRRSRPSQAAADGRGGRAPRGSRVPDLRQPPFRGPRRDRGRRARRCASADRRPVVELDRRRAIRRALADARTRRRRRDRRQGPRARADRRRCRHARSTTATSLAKKLQGVRCD